jgi:hypothetical protein
MGCNSGGYVDVVNYIVGCDRGRRAITYLNAVLGGGRSGTHTDEGVPGDSTLGPGLPLLGPLAVIPFLS